MSKKIEFRIPQPCHENWGKMISVEQGKFCMACKKKVVDFSMMSDQEILLYLSKSTGNVCGRFIPEQLSREINISEEKKFLSWKYALNILLTLFITNAEAGAQSIPVLNKVKGINKPVTPPLECKEVTDTVRGDQVIQTSIVDAEDSTPISFASITIRGRKAGFVADLNGHFDITGAMKEKDTIIVSAVGYESGMFTIAEMTKSKDFPIVKLQRSGELMGDITVVGHDLRRSIAGAISVINKDPIFRKVRDSFITTFIKNAIAIFPNPALKGSVIHFKLGIKEQGNYTMQIINTAGQIVNQQTIEIKIQDQVKQLFIQTHYPSGMYFVRIENCSDKKLYQNKFIIK